MLDFSKKRNGRKINVLYPHDGEIHNMLITLWVETNPKIATISAELRPELCRYRPNGKFITVQETDGKIRSLSLSKVVQSLS